MQPADTDREAAERQRWVDELGLRGTWAKARGIAQS
jgi:hypothetical protein